jgi:hypothetical protein
MAQQLKVCLTNRGQDQETPWAEDLGPAPGPRGSRRVRLINVPFLHAKPTWGDTIVVLPVADGFPTWDRNGVPFAKIGTRIVEDGGRWAMIVDYVPRGVTTSRAFGAIAKACAGLDVVTEGAWEPRGDDPGRIYLAPPSAMSDTTVMIKLRAARLPCELIQVHPEPKTAKPKKRPSKKKSRKKR